MRILTFAVIGTSFWSTFQVSAQRETIGADNLKTVELIYTAYDSAAQNAVVRL